MSEEKIKEGKEELAERTSAEVEDLEGFEEGSPSMLVPGTRTVAEAAIPRGTKVTEIIVSAYVQRKIARGQKVRLAIEGVAVPLVFKAERVELQDRPVRIEEKRAARISPRILASGDLKLEARFEHLDQRQKWKDSVCKVVEQESGVPARVFTSGESVLIVSWKE
jgi:hypothetical protein